MRPSQVAGADQGPLRAVRRTGGAAVFAFSMATGPARAAHRGPGRPIPNATTAANPTAPLFTQFRNMASITPSCLVRRGWLTESRPGDPCHFCDLLGPTAPTEVPAPS